MMDDRLSSLHHARDHDQHHDHDHDHDGGTIVHHDHPVARRPLAEAAGERDGREAFF